MSSPPSRRPRSQLQAAASRSNGRRSRGPASSTGLASSSMNGVRSGLYAKAIAVRGEDLNAIGETVRGWVASAGPRSFAGVHLAGHAANIAVRLDRADRVRQRILEELLVENASDSPVSKALSFASDTKASLEHLGALAADVHTTVPHGHAMQLFEPLRRVAEAVVMLNLPPDVGLPFALAVGAVDDENSVDDVPPDRFAALASAAAGVVIAIDDRLPDLERKLEEERRREAEDLELGDHPRLRQVDRVRRSLLKELEATLRSMSALRELESKVVADEPEPPPINVSFTVIGGR